MDRQQLIKDLTNRTLEVIDIFNIHFKNLSWEELNWKPNADKWSIAECLEHLNMYADYYTVEMSKAMDKNGSAPNKTKVKKGWIGDYFAKSMLPGDQMKKMNSPKDKNPTNSSVRPDVLQRFEDHQQTYLELLSRAKDYDLSGNRVPVTIATWLKIRLGDIFRVNVYHNQRHTQQAMRVLDALKERATVS